MRSKLHARRLQRSASLDGVRQAMLALLLVPAGCLVEDPDFRGPGFIDDVETDVFPWTVRTLAGVEAAAWHRTDDLSHDGGWAWRAPLVSPGGRYPGNVELVLESPDVALGASNELRFHHFARLAASIGEDCCYDGGVAEVSYDAGESWQSLEPDGGYPCTICAGVTGAVSWAPGDRVWGALIGQNGAWAETFVNVPRESGGARVRLRFLAGDNGDDPALAELSFTGWAVDDIELVVVE
jgi:hypothetical protein